MQATAPRSRKGLLSRFLPYYKKYWKTVIFDLMCAGLTTVCELVLPMIVSTITERATTDVASLTVAFVLRLGGLYLVLRVIDVIRFASSKNSYDTQSWI